jgi:hypothetical protein
MKICRCCKLEKADKQFSPEPRNTDKLDSYCRSCRANKRKLFRVNNPEKVKAKTKEIYYKHQDVLMEKAKNGHKNTKLEVFTRYSNGTPTCKQCGFSDLRALSIDHINGGGLKHRRLLGISGGSGFYHWLKRNNYPEGYQVLCMNCQYIKKETNKECYEKKTT